jgi:hypothetical protein
VKKKKTISERIESFVRKIVDESTFESPLNISQQLNYAAVLLRTMGNKMEEEYKKKSYGRT